MDRFLLGWSPMWDHYVHNRSRESVVRITERHKNIYRALTPAGKVLNCRPSGKMVHETISAADFPAVGDWCLIGDIVLDASNEPAATIEMLLPRRSKIARTAVYLSDEQVLAANVDYAFIVTSLNRDYNLNRLRRFVLLAESGRSQPIIVLSKVDLNDQLDDRLDELRRTFSDMPCIATSATTHVGVTELRSFLVSGKTGVFIGSSGVGKSTLINSLLSVDVQKIGAIRQHDQRGRHTTSGAGLFLIPEGGLIIDTAGLREVAVLGDDADLDNAISSIPALARQCRFRNCSHTSEPGCHVQDALEKGDLPQEEMTNYTKLEREIAYGKRKQDQRLAAEERKRWKKISILQRQKRNMEERL